MAKAIALCIRTLAAARLVLDIGSMMDLIYLMATAAFFAIALSYLWGCIRL